MPHHPSFADEPPRLPQQNAPRMRVVVVAVAVAITRTAVLIQVLIELLT